MNVLFARAIGTAIGLAPAEILFLSDTREELDAARRAGMCTAQVVRDGVLDTAAAHPQVNDFDALTAASFFERH